MPSKCEWSQLSAKTGWPDQASVARPQQSIDHGLPRLELFAGQEFHQPKCRDARSCRFERARHLCRSGATTALWYRLKPSERRVDRSLRRSAHLPRRIVAKHAKTPTRRGKRNSTRLPRMGIRKSGIDRTSSAAGNLERQHAGSKSRWKHRRQPRRHSW